MNARNVAKCTINARVHSLARRVYLPTKAAKIDSVTAARLKELGHGG